MTRSTADALLDDGPLEEPYSEDTPRPTYQSKRTETLAGTMSLRASKIREHRENGGGDSTPSEQMSDEAKAEAHGALDKIRALFRKG